MEPVFISEGLPPNPIVPLDAPRVTKPMFVPTTPEQMSGVHPLADTHKRVVNSRSLVVKDMNNALIEKARR